MQADDNKRVIRIESILGGISKTKYFSAEDEYLDAVAVDPMMLEPTTDITKYSGILRPIPSQDYAIGTLNSTPIWMSPNPKTNETFVYDAVGSVYTIEFSGSASFTGIGDLTDGGSSNGNGMAYYDNYMYFARATTIARYGPLNGTAAFTDDYWVGTLGLTALSNEDYPRDNVVGLVKFPNHVMQKHSDGKLYFADFVGGQGTIHYISTTKTTVEGDTNAGSTYNALDLGFNLKPTAMASYGEFLVIGLYDGQGGLVGINSGRFPARAQIIFWDGISQSPNKIIYDAFPDSIITGMTVLNGVLYVVSSLKDTRGVRISKYIGGDSFSEFVFLPNQYATLPGGIIGHGNRLFFGSSVSTDFDTSLSACTYALDVDGQFAGALHCIMAAQEYGGGSVYSLALSGDEDDAIIYPISGYGVGTSYVSSCGIFGFGTVLEGDNRDPVWWSQLYRIGQPFKIKKIRIPLGNAITTNNEFRVTIFFDGQDDDNKTLTSVSNSNFSGKRIVTLMPESAIGNHSFWLQIEWIGTAPIAIALPITIEYELLDD